MSKQFRIFSVAKGPVTAVKRALTPANVAPGDLAAALRDAQRPVSDAERKAHLAAAMTPKAVSK